MLTLMSGVPRGSVLVPQLLHLYTAELLTIENNLYSYANDSALIAVVALPGERLGVTESLNHDRNRVSIWCDLWCMKLNARLRL